MNVYRIFGEEQPEEVRHDEQHRRLTPPIEYEVHVAAPSAEDAWFMHLRNVENEPRLRQRLVRWDGLKTYTHDIQRRRPTRIDVRIDVANVKIEPIEDGL